MYPVLCCLNRSAGVLLVIPTYKHSSTPLNCGLADLNFQFSVKTRFDNSTTYTRYTDRATGFDFAECKLIPKKETPAIACTFLRTRAGGGLHSEDLDRQKNQQI